MDHNTSPSSSKKLRVGVLLGGQSNEKEISLASGRNVIYKLSPHKYEVLPLFVNSALKLYHIDQRLLVRNTTAEIESGLADLPQIPWSALPELVDFVFIGLHGGHGENGCIQGILETLQLPYNGPGVLASALCMDKWKTKELLQQEGIDVPLGVLVTAHAWHQQELATFTFPDFPLIVKPHDDGCSVMVQKVTNDEDLKKAINLVLNSGKSAVLVEECINGIELSVGVIGNQTCQALPASMPVAQKGILSLEEKFLPGAGENQTPAPLSVEAHALVKKVMEDTYKAVGCKGYTRIDCFYQSADASPTKTERVIVLELNTLPALTPATCLFHQAAEIGLHPKDFIDLIIQLGLELHTPHMANKDTLLAKDSQESKKLGSSFIFSSEQL